ncbi:MAG: alanine--tRNA ligase [Bacteroidales bacterium]
MLTSLQIRQQFMDFFASKHHRIVSSAPMVVKDDPTLMFTNAGMNQFKDIFLGNRPISDTRIANTQKCLRVSGKHNDLEEVGHDTYHHTMFEMLGNWSFGDYFKQEAIAWAWELLTGVYGIDQNRLFATIFEGDKKDGLEPDSEAGTYWQQYLPLERILPGSKKDNFWEMGDSGPCGPCSEIHIDLRDEKERQRVDGADLVNKDHPEVIEIWNLVFIQYNRLADGSLVPLPDRHVDTGMGFERLCRVLQGKKSNYDTDIFQPVIRRQAELSGKIYGVDPMVDVAFRVIADHLRAVSFSIADGQLPSNVKAGYVIRRILRRAIRYGYTYLGFREPVINQLVPVLVQQMGDVFPELKAQKTMIMRVIAEEEISFLRTLETGIHLLEQITEKMADSGVGKIDGKTAFLLYDTYGFPLDLTALIMAEKGMEVDNEGFREEMEAQKNRSRDAAKMEADDWVNVNSDAGQEGFIGYDTTESEVRILRYRKIMTREKTLFQLVFNRTPFYPESGGQVGDQGFITATATGDKTRIISTKFENQLIVHSAEKLPVELSGTFHAAVDHEARRSTARNHSATHLLHHALREILGTHVEQKGSLVHPDYFRFDFAHFRKMTPEELAQTEARVNQMILMSVNRDERRNIPLAEAKEMGAMSLFGEKYGDEVRVIRFGNSVELCGGIHVESTGEIGVFKILSEGAIAAGVRRIEAITGLAAIRFYEEQLATVNALRELVRNPKEPLKSVQALIERNRLLEEQLAIYAGEHAASAVKGLIASAEEISGIRFVGNETTLASSDIKDIAFRLRETESNLVMVLTSVNDGKAGIAIFVSSDLIKGKGLHAGNMVKALSPIIQGGGGGQDFFATAGGKNTDGLPEVIARAKELLNQA